MKIRLGIIAVFCMVLAGCMEKAGAGGTVKFGAAEPATEKLPIVVSDTDVVPASQWPSACEFITDREINSILPQAYKIKRQPQKVTILPRSYLDGSKSETADEGSCKYTFELKGANVEDITSSIEVSIYAIGKPELITPYYNQKLTEYSERKDQSAATDRGAELGPQACFTRTDISGSATYITCKQGPLMFEVGGMGSGADDFEGVAEEREARRDYWQQKVQIPVAQIISQKTP